MHLLVLALTLVSAPSVLLYAVDADDFDARRLQLLRGSLRLELEKIDGLSVVDIDRLVTRAPEARDCDIRPPEGRACLARFAEAYASEEVVTARASRVGGLSVLLLKRLRLSDGEIVANVTRNLSRGGGEEFLLALGGAVEELYADKALRAGQTRGVSLELAGRWTPNPIPTWAVWTGAAVSAGLLGGGLYAFVGSRQAAAEHQDIANEARATTVMGARLVALEEEARTKAELATGLLLGGLASCLATGLLAVFADWGEDPAWPMPG